MTRRSLHQWLVGLTVLVTLVQGPAVSWAAHGHGGGGHIGGGHMGGGAHFGGGHIGGGHMGGGFGGAHFSAPAHHFSAPTQHFSAPSHAFQTPRAMPSANFHAPTMHHVQPTLGNHTANHNAWTLPTHNGVTHNPTIQNGLQTRGHTPNVATFGQHHNPTQGLLHNGTNPYLTGNHHGNIGGDAIRSAHGTNLPGVTGNHALSNLNHGGRDALLGNHGTFKPATGGNNPFGNHPHIGGQHLNASHTALANVGGAHNGLHHGGQNLPQFQSHHHGNNGNWGLGGPRGGNGVNGGNWNNSWRNNFVHHHHHGWYNGAWGGYWGFGAYAPFFWGARYWGLGGFYSPWGFGYGGYGYGGYGYGYGAYYNPYCVAMVQPVYASLPMNYYTQPIALPQQPVSDEADANKAAAYALVDAARNDFRSGDYQAALTKLDQAIPQLPNDTVVHELRGVTLFALGEFRPAAATLNALLAVAPGMDWATLRGLYPDAQTYEAQLRRLEDAARNDQKDPALRFVLAYFYMVTNYPEAAKAQLTKVVELEPKDVVAKKLLESLTPSNDATPPAASPEAGTNVPATDLVGNWKASVNGSTFELSLNDGLQFEWKVTPANGEPIKQTGRYTATTDRLILESTGQETLVAKVQSLGTDRFQMWANDKQALVFDRQGGISVAKPIESTVVQPPSPLIPAPKPTGEANVPAPLTPVIGADGKPVDATQPENPVLPPVP